MKTLNEIREFMEAFKREKGYEKCTLLIGIGARLATEIIIESIEEDKSV